MSRVRVLTLLGTLRAAGGAERLAVEIAAGLDPGRFDRTLVATRARRDAPFVERLERAGVRVVQLDRRHRLDLLSWLPLFRLLRETDVVHAHMFGSNVWGTLFGRLCRVPVVVAHEHTWSYEGQPLRRFLDRELIARFSSVFVAVSRDDARKMTEVEGIDPSAIRFVPNGIPPLPPAGDGDVRAELGLPPGAPLVLTVGVLRPQKAFHVLVEAAAAVRDRVPEARVLIAGDGDERERLRSEIARRGLEDVVILLGSRRDVPDLLAAADLCVSSSDFEGSPLAVMEYMAAGKPTVATAVGGVPDLLDDGVHGHLVPRRDAAALADRIVALLESPETRARMGAAARERQQREFTLEAMIARIETLYAELIAAARSRGRIASS